MAEWKLPDEARAETEAELAELHSQTADFEVHRDNWRAVCLFERLGTQWRLAVGMSGAIVLGLDYAGVAAAMALAGVRKAAQGRLFADLQLMEMAALPEMNRRKGKPDGA